MHTTKYVILFLFLLSFISDTKALIIYNSNNSSDYTLLRENGFTYVKTGNETMDNGMISVLEEYWNFSNFKIIEKSEVSELDSKDILMTFMTIGSEYYNRKTLIWLKVKDFQNDMSSMYDSVGYCHIDAFNRQFDNMEKYSFFKECISSFNSLCQTISENDIKSRGKNIYQDIHKSLLSKTAQLKNKTLLLVGKANFSGMIKALQKNNISYKEMTSEDYFNLTEDELKNYCLVYCSADFAILDLETNELIYHKHDQNLSREMKIIKKIITL